MTDYKKVTRKSREQKAKTQGVRMKKTNVSSIKAGGTCFCGRTSVKGGLCPSCRDNGVFFEKLKIEQAQQNPKNVGAMQRKAKTVSIPKFHRVKEQEDGLVKFWAESSDGKTVASLIQSNKFPDEMEIRIALPDFEKITVRGSKDIMDNLTFEEFLDKAKMHLERQHLMREKREPFPVGERRPTGLGDQDVIEAVSGKKLTQTDLIAMQRATRKKGDLSDEDFQRRQEIVRKLNDAKHNVDKVAKRKIDPSNEQQFNKKSRALGRANDKLAIQKQKFKKEFGVEVVDI
jgi:hypothetical protein